LTLSDSQRVAIVGLGAVTPLGNDVPSSWETALAGRSGVALVTQFDTAEMKTQIAAEVKEFDPTQYMDRREARRTDRFLHLALAAAKEAVADSGLDMASQDPRRVGVLVGSAVGGIHVLIEQIDVLRTRGPRRVSPFAITGLMVNGAAGQIAIMLACVAPTWHWPRPAPPAAMLLARPPPLSAVVPPTS